MSNDPRCYAFRHLCAKERNLLLTELAWRKIPKDKDEQMIMGIPRGSPKEEDLHRLRYAEVSPSAGLASFGTSLEDLSPLPK